MQADIESYMTCHPAILMNARHKKVIPSLLTRPHGKNRVRIKLKPPKLMVNKWFFQQHIAETGLVTIKTAACNLRYSFLGCCNSNQLVAFLCPLTTYITNQLAGETTKVGPNGIDLTHMHKL